MFTHLRLIFFPFLFMLLILVINCVQVTSVQKKSLLRMNSYKRIANFPNVNRKIVRIKLFNQGKIKSLDLLTNREVDYLKVYKSEKEAIAKKRGNFSKYLDQVSNTYGENKKIEVFITFLCKDYSSSLLSQWEKNINKYKNLTKFHINKYKKYKKSYIQNCHNKFIKNIKLKYQLSKIYLFPFNLKIRASVKFINLLKMKKESNITQISHNSKNNAGILSCNPSISVDKYYGQSYHSLGSIQSGSCGDNVIVAQVEFFAPETNQPCFNYGNIETRAVPLAPDPAKQYHANAVARRIIGMANPHPSCPYPSRDPKNNIIKYGAATSVTLIAANTLSSADPAAFDWAHERGADIFSVSMIQYYQSPPNDPNPTQKPFNHFDTAADLKGDYQLPIMGGGNYVNQEVGNVVYNGIIVGSFGAPSLGEPPFPIFHHSYNDLGYAASSSYKNPVTIHGDMHRPDVVAFEPDGSSSLVTPIVSALAAQLIGKLPFLKYNPITTKVLIMSTACLSFGDDNSTSNRFFKPQKYGAGGIYAPNAMGLASSMYQKIVGNCGGTYCWQGIPNDDYKLGWTYLDRTSSSDFEIDTQGRSRYKWPNGQPTFTVQPIPFGKTIRVVLAWNHMPSTYNTMTDYDLILQKWNTETNKWIDVSYSSSFDNNWEMIKYYHNSNTSQKYRIEVIKWGSYSTPGTFNSYFDKFAWSTFIHDNFHPICSQ